MQLVLSDQSELFLDTADFGNSISSSCCSSIANSAESNSRYRRVRDAAAAAAVAEVGGIPEL